MVICVHSLKLDTITAANSSSAEGECFFVCTVLSLFLIGQTFFCEPSWKYLPKLYSGSKKLYSTCSGNIRPIRRSLPLIGCEQSSPVEEEK